MHDIIKDFGPEYDKLWIFSKIHHEMNQLCSKSTLQEIYVDKFDQVEQPCAYCALSVTVLHATLWHINTYKQIILHACQCAKVQASQGVLTATR